jgi:hypothetical protein
MWIKVKVHAKLKIHKWRIASATPSGEKGTEKPKLQVGIKTEKGRGGDHHSDRNRNDEEDHPHRYDQPQITKDPGWRDPGLEIQDVDWGFRTKDPEWGKRSPKAPAGSMRILQPT